MPGKKMGLGALDPAFVWAAFALVPGQKVPGKSSQIEEDLGTFAQGLAAVKRSSDE